MRLSHDQIDGCIDRQHTSVAVNVSQPVQKDGQIVAIVELLGRAVPAQRAVLGGILLIAASGQSHGDIAAHEVDLEDSLLDGLTLKYINSAMENELL